MLLCLLKPLGSFKNGSKSKDGVVARKLVQRPVLPDLLVRRVDL
jgi:hypothetical protein